MVIKAVINQQIGATSDPTPNAIQWLGKTNTLTKKQKLAGETLTPADKSYNLKVKEFGENKVLRRDGDSKRTHIFYDSRSQSDIDRLKTKKQKK